MNYSEAEHWLRTELHKIYEEREAATIAGWVIEHITGLPRMERLKQNTAEITQEHASKIADTARRLLAYEPVQYVLQESHFYGLKLFVNNQVLIPRPETEELVDWILQDVAASGKEVWEQKKGEADATKTMKILDVGTGSGCIALALKKNLPKAEVWGCDTSDGALTVARRNGSDLDIRVDFVGLNFLDEAQRKQLPTVDIIVSNPPYVPQGEKQNMRPNVAEYEPATALFVPDNDPLLFYKALAYFGKDRLYANGSIYCELHEDYAQQTGSLFAQLGYKQVETKKDMQGKERMLRARF